MYTSIYCHERFKCKAGGADTLRCSRNEAGISEIQGAFERCVHGCAETRQSIKRKRSMDRACVLPVRCFVHRSGETVRGEGRYAHSGFIKIDMEHLFALFVYPVWNMQAAGLVD